VQSADHAPVEGQQAASAIGIAALLLAPPIGVTVAGYDLASSVVGTYMPTDRRCPLPGEDRKSSANDQNDAIDQLRHSLVRWTADCY